MKYLHFTNGVLISVLSVVITACSTGGSYHMQQPLNWNPYEDFSRRLPQAINTHGEKVILVDPNVRAWGAYTADGQLVKAGIATSGGRWCEDTQRPCYTSMGTFRIQRLGGPECKSSIYPKPTGGGLMPYCMHFHGAMSLHGSPDTILGEENISHGCVRMRIQDAEWVRYNFANVGTKVIVRPYT